jgi:hypothetical protein
MGFPTHQRRRKEKPKMEARTKWGPRSLVRFVAENRKWSVNRPFPSLAPESGRGASVSAPRNSERRPAPCAVCTLNLPFEFLLRHIRDPKRGDSSAQRKIARAWIRSATRSRAHSGLDSLHGAAANPKRGGYLQHAVFAGRQRLPDGRFGPGINGGAAETLTLRSGPR